MLTLSLPSPCLHMHRWTTLYILFLPAALCKAQSTGILVTQADFEVFRPAGATRCTNGGEVWYQGGQRRCPLLYAKFHPHRCNGKGIGLQKLKFLFRFDQNVEYKRPTEAYPLSDFHKICRVCTPFQDCWICSRGYGVMGVLSWWGLVVPKFSAPPSYETTCQISKRFRGARTCSRSSITMPSLVGLGFHLPPEWPKTLSFLTVCPLCFRMSEIVRQISP